MFKIELSPIRHRLGRFVTSMMLRWYMECTGWGVAVGVLRTHPVITCLFCNSLTHCVSNGVLFTRLMAVWHFHGSRLVHIFCLLYEVVMENFKVSDWTPHVYLGGRSVGQKLTVYPWMTSLWRETVDLEVRHGSLTWGSKVTTSNLQPLTQRTWVNT